MEPDEEETTAKKLAELVVKKNYHIDCGILGIKYIFNALAKFGYGDVLYKVEYDKEKIKIICHVDFEFVINRNRKALKKGSYEFGLDGC